MLNPADLPAFLLLRSVSFARKGAALLHPEAHTHHSAATVAHRHREARRIAETRRRPRYPTSEAGLLPLPRLACSPCLGLQIHRPAVTSPSCAVLHERIFSLVACSKDRLRRPVVTCQGMAASCHFSGHPDELVPRYQTDEPAPPAAQNREDCTGKGELEELPAPSARSERARCPAWACETDPLHHESAEDIPVEVRVWVVSDCEERVGPASPHEMSARLSGSAQLGSSTHQNGFDRELRSCVKTSKDRLPW